MFISYLSMKTLLITGANGFIGSRLIEKFIDKKSFKLVLNSFSDPSIYIKKLMENNENIKFIKSDIADTESVYDCVLRSDYVFHLASIVGKNLSEVNVYKTFDSNVLGSLNIFRACRDAKKKISYLSIPNLDDYSLYALSKSCSDRFAQMYLNLHNLDISIIRLFNCYGINQNDKSGKLIVNVLKNAIKNLPIKIHGDGSQRLNFIHIDDVVDGLSIQPLNHKRGIFYFGSDTEMTVNEVVEKIVNITKSKSEIIYENNRVGDENLNVILSNDVDKINLKTYRNFDNSIKDLSKEILKNNE